MEHKPTQWRAQTYQMKIVTNKAQTYQMKKVTNGAQTYQIKIVTINERDTDVPNKNRKRKWHRPTKWRRYRTEPT